MKKIISLLMIIVLAVSLVACGKKVETVETHCQKCGEAVADDVAFCHNCDASLTNSQENQTESFESNTDSTASVPDFESNTDSAASVPDDDFYNEVFDYKGDGDHDYDYDYDYDCDSNTSSTTSEIDEVIESKHEHSFVPEVTNPTCTQRGYTKYACSCGWFFNDDYTEPQHTYAEHICSACGYVEPSYTYEYLLNWYKQTGKETIAIKQYDGKYLYSLGYSETEESLYLKQSGYPSIAPNVVVYLNSGNEFDYVFDDLSNGASAFISLAGVIKADEYTGSLYYDIEYTSFYGDHTKLSWALNHANYMIDNMINLLDKYFKKNIPEITIKGLGFTSYSYVKF